MADLTHYRKKRKENKAKPQPSTKNNHPPKNNYNPAIQPTDLITVPHDQSHHHASKLDPQTTTTMTHYRNPLKQIKSHREIEFRERVFGSVRERRAWVFGFGLRKKRKALVFGFGQREKGRTLVFGSMG